MKRSLLALLIAVVIAGWIGTLVARDPGYVMISYDGATLQTGLWVFLALVLTAAAIVYTLLRLLNIVGGTAGAFRSWRRDRARAKAAMLTTRGLVYLQQGEYERAEKFLESGARGNENPAAIYIYAAKAADALGKQVEREAWLRKAQEADEDTRQAVAVAGAEMAIGRGEYDRALELLKTTDANAAVIGLQQKALLASKNWQGLVDLMPKIKKVNGDLAELKALQKQVALERLSAPGTTDDSLVSIYKKLDDDIKHDEAVAKAYCSHLQGESAAEQAIRVILKQHWFVSLLTQYGELGKDTLAKRIKTAEGWIKQHPDDAALQLCLGRLYEANGDKDKASRAYEKSIDLGDLPEAAKHLGRLLAFDGDYKKSTEYLTHALK